MSRTISQLTAPETIWIYETVDGVTEAKPYIYLGLDENGKARVLRKYIAGFARMNETRVATYGGSEMDAFLEDETTGFLSRFDSATLGALVNTSITYLDYNVTEAPAYPSIARRCFLGSAREFNMNQLEPVGTNYIPLLKTYYGTTSQETARTGRTEDEIGCKTWTRSALNTTQFRVLLNYGGASNGIPDATDMGYRPMLSIDPATPVSDAGAMEIFLLPDSHRTYWPIAAQIDLGSSEARPVRGRLFLPHTVTGLLTVQVCNNFRDAAPTWVDCEPDGVAVFGTAKTASTWRLGVKVNAQALSPKERIYEPVLAVVCEAAG